MRTRPVALILSTALLAGLATVSVAAPAAAATSSAAPAPAGTTVLVKYRESSSQAGRSNAERAAKARKVGHISRVGVTVLEVPAGADAVRQLRASGQVEYAELDGVVAGESTPTDELWAQQWGPARVHLPEAWDRAQPAGVVVAVLDTGVDATHEDLTGRVLPGYDFINSDSDPADDHGHGTKVAGVLAATANNSVGVAGGCWTCSVLPVKVLNSSNSGTWAALASGIVWATDNGARVISMSLSGSTPSAAVQDAVTYAHQQGVLLVAAAGNQGIGDPRYPAAYPEVLSVGGTTETDGRQSWSNYGSTVDIAAPGCNMAPQRGGGYVSFCGTSSAAPLTAGVAAMSMATSPGLSAADVTAVLTSTAVVNTATLMGGRVDAGAALDVLQPVVTAPVVTVPVVTEPVAPPVVTAPVVAEPVAPPVEPTPVATEPAPAVLAAVPAPSPSTEPQPQPTASVEPVPTPVTAPVTVVEPAPATPVTSTFSGELLRSAKRASFPVTIGAGHGRLELAFTTASTRGTVSLVDSAGRVVVTASGRGVIQVAAELPAGAYLVLVDAARTAFTVTFTHQTLGV